MRKTMVIAAREYRAAVRTKTFVISLVMLPILMAGSFLLQRMFRGIVDTQDKHFVLVSHQAPRPLLDAVTAALDAYNRTDSFDKETHKQIKPRFIIDKIEPAAQSAAAHDRLRLTLSDQIRDGQLVGFMEIIPAGYKHGEGNKPRPPADDTYAPLVLRYQTNRPTFLAFSRFVEKVVTDSVRAQLGKKAGLNRAQTLALASPVAVEFKGLVKLDAGTGAIAESSEQGRFAGVIVPGVMMMLMFMVILMTATPLMQGIVEEKMQRIAEVLLGSVPPFELMMGKILGMVGVSLTIAGVYLGGAYWAAQHFGIADSISIELLIWFVIFQALAGLMFGSLFIAIGAACTDMKETQNLLWPVMLLACLPMFLLGNILQEPSGPIARGLSFFPFATPTLMMARIASPPGIPWWEPAIGVALVLATTLLCVYVAGRIFRIGILLQGKGARLGEILTWAIRG
ncbi:MAG: ABC transporter permease [Planctomycetes bacterium]|nr:ABC transporter permease [Planctomycetota bacterium]